MNENQPILFMFHLSALILDHKSNKDVISCFSFSETKKVQGWRTFFLVLFHAVGDDTIID